MAGGVFAGASRRGSGALDQDLGLAADQHPRARVDEVRVGEELPQAAERHLPGRRAERGKQASTPFSSTRPTGT